MVNAKDFGDLDNQLDDIREKTCSKYLSTVLIRCYNFKGKHFERMGV